MEKENGKSIDINELLNEYENSNISIRDVAKKIGIDIKKAREYIKNSGSKKFKLRTRSFGRQAWNKGLNKHNNEKIANIAKKLSKHRQTHGIQDGYETVYCDSLKTRLKKHHYTWFKETGHLPDTKNGEQIHHIDGNKKNNDFNNLILVSVSEHAKIHKKYEELTFKLIKKGYVHLNKDTKELDTEFLWRMLNENEE